MFTPGFLEAYFATVGAAGAIFLYALWEIRQRKKENAEIEAEERAAEAARIPAE